MTPYPQVDSPGLSKSRGRTKSVLRACLLGALAALLMSITVFAAATLTGSDLAVSPPGRPSGPVPLGALMSAVIAAAIANTILALVLQRLQRARVIYLVVTLAAVAVSFTTPVSAADTTDAALWLSLMHVTTAAGLIPITARALGEVRSRP